VHCFLDQQDQLFLPEKIYKIFTADLAQAADLLEHKNHYEKRDVFSVFFPLDVNDAI